MLAKNLFGWTTLLVLVGSGVAACSGAEPPDSDEPAFCGGIAAIPCPAGKTCIDDPQDGCDPQRGGADCGGICVDAADTCGEVTCGKGTICCNPLRGICTKPGMVCIQ